MLHLWDDSSSSSSNNKNKKLFLYFLKKVHVGQIHNPEPILQDSTLKERIKKGHDTISQMLHLRDGEKKKEKTNTLEYI